MEPWTWRWAGRLANILQIASGVGLCSGAKLVMTTADLLGAGIIVASLTAIGFAWWINRRRTQMIEFFADRVQLDSAHPLSKEIDATKKVYGLFLSGQGVLTAFTDDILKTKFRAILTPEPTLEAVKNLWAHAGTLWGEGQLEREINNTLITAERLAIPHGSYQHFLGATALIGDPETISGWANIEICLPHMHPNHRPAFRLTRQHHAEAFDRFWNTYRALCHQAGITLD